MIPMKRKPILSIISCAALLVTGLLFNSCKKEIVYEETVPDLTPQIYYRQRVTGANADEYRAVKVDGTNDHKLIISLPAGWEPTNNRHFSDGTDNMVVSAYNSTTKLYSLFSGLGIEGVTFKQITAVSSPDPVAIQSVGNNPVPHVWYGLYKPNNVIEFDIAGIPPITVQGAAKILPPANASFVGEPALQEVGNNIIFTTRTEDPVSHQYIYAINKLNTNASGSTPLITGEPGVVITIEKGIYPNSVLYSKVKNNGLVTELWSVTFDGTNDKKVEIPLPAGAVLKNKAMVNVASDGRLAFLCTTSADNAATAREAIYTANADGTNVKLVKQFAAGVSVGIQAYATYAWY